MNSKIDVQARHQAILRTPIAEADAASIATRIETGAMSVLQHEAALLNSARASSIPALMIQHLFLGKVKKQDDVDYFAAAYKSARTSAETLQPGAPEAVYDLNAFQALGADLAGAPSVNAHFLELFGALINPGSTADPTKDRAFIDAACELVTSTNKPDAEELSRLEALLHVLRTQYGSDLMAKGALLGRIAGEALTQRRPNVLVERAEQTLRGLGRGGAFKPGPLGDNLAA